MLALLLAVAHHAYDPNPLAHFWYWVEIHTGAINESDSYYGWWSGFASDIGEVTLVTGGVLALRHINCHESGCWRRGHVVPESGVRACHKHHPTNPRNRRNGSVAEMHEAQK